MFKADDYRLKIQGMRGVLGEAGYALDLENQRVRLEELKREQEQPEVWQDLENRPKPAARSPISKTKSTPIKRATPP
ncbi:MAG: hypothetical protein ACLS4Z_01700 [Christensenellaceae bacterium]